jgi:subtilisin family serine protease
MEATMNSKSYHRHFKLTKLKWLTLAGALAFSSQLSTVPAQEIAGIFSGTPSETKRLIVVLEEPEADSNTRSSGTRDRKDKVATTQDRFISQLTDFGSEISGAMSGVTVEKLGQFNPIVVVNNASLATAEAIKNTGMAVIVEEDVPHPPTLSDSIPLIGADSAWGLGYSGAGQAVAVLDTGVDKTHPDLRDQVVEEACYSTTSSAYSATTVCPNGSEEQQGKGAGVNCDSSISGCNHGTHVAGIVAANGSVTGVAKDADIIAIQVFSKFNSSTYCGGSSSPCALSFTSDQIAGLDRVLELHQNGMAIAAVNMSLGGGNYSDVCTGAIQTVIGQLRDAGIATIVASGNSGYTNGIASPACIASAISVGATTDSDNVASFSNSADILDLLAPGSGIISTLPGGSQGSKSGTSMAAPHVAGAWAILKSADPTASVDDLLKLLKNTGQRIEDSRSGIPNPPRITKRINLAKAIERLVPAETTAPDIQVQPSSYDFGDVSVGDSSSVKRLTISNVGDGDLDIGSLSLAGADFIISRDNCSNTTVAAGANCTVTITFTPSSEGAKTATVSIPSNDSDTPTATVTLTGNGIEAVQLLPDISVTPMSYDFGDVLVGESGTKRLTISNVGDTDLNIGSLSMAGADFISRDNCSNTSVAAGANCTVTITFTPSSEGAKTVTVSIPSNDPDTATVEVNLTGHGLIEEQVATPTPATCQLYAVQDEGLNNSQFFTINPDDGQVSNLGPMYKGYDIESLAIHPQTNIIYAASGDDVANGKEKGHLYMVDGQTGELFSVGNTGFDEIEDLAFSADGETLWAWAKGDGLIKINVATGAGVMVVTSDILVEGLTLNINNDNILYGAVKTDLLKYDMGANTLEVICAGKLLGETESLERVPPAHLLFGTHKDKTLSLHLLDPSTCEIIVDADIPTDQFDDVEGIGWPLNCQ